MSNQKTVIVEVIIEKQKAVTFFYRPDARRNSGTDACG